MPEENGFKLDIAEFCGYAKRAIGDMEKDVKELKNIMADFQKETQKTMTSFQDSVGTLKLKVAGIGAVVSLLTSLIFLVVKSLIAK